MAYAENGKFERAQKRDCERVDVLAPVTFKPLETGGAQMESHGVALDLSADGIFIQTMDRVEKDTLVDIDVDLLQLHDHITATGKVVRTEESGFAARFRSRCERLDTVKPL